MYCLKGKLSSKADRQILAWIEVMPLFDSLVTFSISCREQSYVTILLVFSFRSESVTPLSGWKSPNPPHKRWTGTIRFELCYYSEALSILSQIPFRTEQTGQHIYAMVFTAPETSKTLNTGSCKRNFMRRQILCYRYHDHEVLTEYRYLCAGKIRSKNEPFSQYKDRDRTSEQIWHCDGFERYEDSKLGQWYCRPSSGPQCQSTNIARLKIGKFQRTSNFCIPNRSFCRPESFNKYERDANDSTALNHGLDNA